MEYIWGLSLLEVDGAYGAAVSAEDPHGASLPCLGPPTRQDGGGCGHNKTGGANRSPPAQTRLGH